MLALAKAVVVQAPDWHPIRTFVEHAHNKPVGRLVSRKSRRGLPWEGFGERHLMIISEADTAVERFLAQPHRLEINVGGRRRKLVYFPDLMRRMADGTTEIIEVKKTRAEIDRDPDYAFKIAKAESVYGALGWRFRILTEKDDIDRLPTLPNALRIFANKFALIGTREKMAIGEAFDLADELAYAKAIEILGAAGGYDAERAERVLHAMICTRQAGLDLTKRITPDTGVIRPEIRGRH
jgi:hypothetical protein